MVIVDYQRSDEFIEIIVHDGTGRKIETLDCSRRDKKKLKRIMDYLRDKYDFEPYVEPQEKFNKEEKVDWWG